MAEISEYLSEIQNAVYGEEVRSSIVNAIDAINDDVTEAVDAVADALKAESITYDSSDVDENLNQIQINSANVYQALTALIKALDTAYDNISTIKNTISSLAASNVSADTNSFDWSGNNNVQQVLYDLDSGLSSIAKQINELASTQVSHDVTDENSTLENFKLSGATVYAVLNSIADTLDNALENITNLSEETDEILTDVDDIKAYLGYTDEDIVGICVDYQNKTFKRLAGAYDKEAGTDFDEFEMFGGRKRCNVADDGTIVAWYGDDDYAEDGSMGQVMVYQPAFYYKVVPLVYDKNTVTGIGYHLRKANYYVSTKPKTGFKLHPAFYDSNGNAVDYILFSAYEGTMYDVSGEAYVNDGVDTATAIETGDLLCSVAGQKPISGLYKALTKANLELMSQNRGSNWHLENIKATSANQLLMIIELGTMNTQAAIANGVVSITDNSSYNCSSLTGSTSELGNGTGQASTTTNEIGGTKTDYTDNGKTSVTYRGVENPWGNIWKHIQGINIWGDGTMSGGQPYVADGFEYNESKNSDPYQPVGFTLPNAYGYINAMGYGSEDYDWLLMPSEVGGTSALPVGDYCYVTTDLNGYRIAPLGGYWSDGVNAGGFYWRCYYGVSTRFRTIGGRLLYVPTASE